MQQGSPALVEKDLNALQSIIDRKFKSGAPRQTKATDDEVVLVAMLHLRYQDNPELGGEVLSKIQHCLFNWGIHMDECNARARSIWNSGYRPGVDMRASAGIGSGSDVEEQAAQGAT